MDPLHLRVRQIGGENDIEVIRGVLSTDHVRGSEPGRNSASVTVR